MGTHTYIKLYFHAIKLPEMGVKAVWRVGIPLSSRSKAPKRVNLHNYVGTGRADRSGGQGLNPWCIASQC